MNFKQKLVLAIGIAAVGVMIFCPPWRVDVNLKVLALNGNQHPSRFVGLHPITDPPTWDLPLINKMTGSFFTAKDLDPDLRDMIQRATLFWIDWRSLAAEVIVVALLTAGLLKAFASKPEQAPKTHVVQGAGGPLSACPWIAQNVEYKVAGKWAYRGPLIITDQVLYYIPTVDLIQQGIDRTVGVMSYMVFPVVQ